MVSNIDRFKNDLKALITLGDSLLFSMKRETMGKELYDHHFKKKHGNKYDDVLSNLPPMEEKYQSWYSESISVIRQIIPDRVEDFKKLYEKPKNRKEITAENYHIEDSLQGLSVTQDGKTDVNSLAAIPKFAQQIAILKAAERRFESSLFDIRQLVQADLFDSGLDAARELLKNKFNRGAGVIAGVILEKHLKQVCLNRGISLGRKKPTIAPLNDILKNNNVIDTQQWRHIQRLGDLRNKCGHDNDKEPTDDEVADLIDGVSKVMKTIL